MQVGTRVNGDPSTNMYRFRLKITDQNGRVTRQTAMIGGSNEENARCNVLNCYRSWNKGCTVEIDG